MRERAEMQKQPEPPKGRTLAAAQVDYNMSKSDFYKKENQKSIEGQKKDPDYSHDWSSAIRADNRARKAGLRIPDTKERNVPADIKVKTRNVSSKRDGDPSFSGQTLERAQTRKNIEARKKKSK